VSYIIWFAIAGRSGRWAKFPTSVCPTRCSLVVYTVVVRKRSRGRSGGLFFLLNFPNKTTEGGVANVRRQSYRGNDTMTLHIHLYIPRGVYGRRARGMVRAHSVVRRRRRQLYLTCQKPRRRRCGCKWTTSSCIVVVTPHALRPLVMYILYLFKIHNNNIIIYSASKQPNLWARRRLALVMERGCRGDEEIAVFSFIVFLTHDRNPLHCPRTINRCGELYICMYMYTTVFVSVRNYFPLRVFSIYIHTYSNIMNTTTWL